MSWTEGAGRVSGDAVIVGNTFFSFGRKVRDYGEGSVATPPKNFVYAEQAITCVE